MRRDYHDLDFLVPEEDRNEYESFREWMGWNCPVQSPFTMHGARFTAVAQVRGLNIYACDKDPKITGNFDVCYIVISGRGEKMKLAMSPEIFRSKILLITGEDSIRKFLPLIRFRTWEECPRTIVDLEDVLSAAMENYNRNWEEKHLKCFDKYIEVI